ncbi:hypothetical protein JTB14_023178 [Gonioctena quinquepunctata]|nr:hypothetical protein JTB14_023178 [Gonioctena quinquepunctata]
MRPVSKESKIQFTLFGLDFDWNSLTLSKEVTTLEEFNETLSRDWKGCSASEIVNAFTNTKNFCKSKNIALSDNRFDNLVDGLINNCEQLNDEELVNLLYCISEFPSCESYEAHNFHDIWSCLDDICCWKVTNWNIDKCLVIANAWYKMKLGRICDFIFILIDRLTKKADGLTKEELVNIFFLFNVCRRRAVDFQYEFALERHIEDMSANEMAVVAMGYFKTKTKIKLLPVIEAMVKEVTANSENIHEIALTAILKVLRLSKPLKLGKEILDMLDVLQYEIDRLSELCCLHIALISTGIHTYHNATLERVSQKVVQNITDNEKIRLKDMERMLNVLSMFDYNPKTTPDIFQSSLAELHKTSRIEEQVKYPRCLPCALNYLSLRNIYSHELMDKVLDTEFIEQTYGKSARMLPRELLSLDCSIDIECPGYKGNRLAPRLKYKGAKWLTEYIPSHDQWKKISAADKLFLDTVATLKTIADDEKFMFINHVLPHFSRADIILCRNQTGRFVQPTGFQNYVLGDVMFPFNDGNLKWYAVVVVGWNNTIRDSSLLLGNIIMKKRQLEKIGYNVVLVLWNEFLKLPKDMRSDYIYSRLKET